MRTGDDGLERSIQPQSSSEIVSEGKSLIVWSPCPATCVSSLWSLNNGITISWQNNPLRAVSSRIPRCPEPGRTRRSKFDPDHQSLAANRFDQFVATLPYTALVSLIEANCLEHMDHLSIEMARVQLITLDLPLSDELFDFKTHLPPRFGRRQPR